MPNTKVLKPKPPETKPRARTSSKRASSCPRCYHDNARDPVAVETRGASKTRATVPIQLKAAQKTRTAQNQCELKTTEKSRVGNSQLQPPSTKPRAHYEIQRYESVLTSVAKGWRMSWLHHHIVIHTVILTYSDIHILWYLHIVILRYRVTYRDTHIPWYLQ